MKTCSKCEVEKSEGELSPDKRKTSGLYARCKECRVEDCRDHREANREKVRESSREWVREHATASAAATSKWRKENPLAVALQNSRSVVRKRGHASCAATVKELEVAFTGHCAICDVPELECKTRLHLDHDHETGEFRGFLCGKCNKMLGLANDSEEILTSSLHYLEIQVKE